MKHTQHATIFRRTVIGLVASLGLVILGSTGTANAASGRGVAVGGHVGGYAGHAYGRGYGYGYGRGFAYGYARYGYGGYRYAGFYPYGFYGGLAFGLYFGALPLYYSTVYYGGIPYYYAYPNYYLYDGAVGQYVTVKPPAGITTATPGPAPALQDKLFAYPKNGQSTEQQDKDRFECHRFAVVQTGFDPTQAPAAVSTAGQRDDYRRAESACLEGHGYAVQ